MSQRNPGRGVRFEILVRGLYKGTVTVVVSPREHTRRFLARGLRYITTPALPCACCCCSCCLHRRDERRKTRAGGERTAAGTLPFIVIVTLSVTVTVVVTVSAVLIVPVAVLATVRCPHIHDAHPKGACVEIRNPHLRRPRS